MVCKSILNSLECQNKVLFYLNPFSAYCVRRWSRALRVCSQLDLILLRCELLGSFFRGRFAVPGKPFTREM